MNISNQQQRKLFTKKQSNQKLNPPLIKIKKQYSQHSNQNQSQQVENNNQFYLTSVDFQDQGQTPLTQTSYRFRDFKQNNDTISQCSANVNNYFKNKINLGSTTSTPKSQQTSNLNDLPSIFNKSQQGYHFQSYNCSSKRQSKSNNYYKSQDNSKENWTINESCLDNISQDIEKEKQIVGKLCSPSSIYPINKDKQDLEFEKQLEIQFLYQKNQNGQFNQTQQQELKEEQIKYQQNYKNYYKVNERNTYFQKEDDIQVKMLKKAYSHSLLPKKLNIICNPDNQKRVSIKNYLLGNKYSSMFSAAIKHSDLSNLTKLNVKNNNLNDNSIKKILKKCPKNIKTLNLQNNNITSSGSIYFKQILDSQIYTQLLYLNLEQNQLQDQGVSQLCKYLKQNEKLKILNLSKNGITDYCVQDICDVLNRNYQHLQELYLHWNQISSSSGEILSESLAKDKQLVVLDLSHNCLGNNRNMQSGLKIIQSLNSNLRHLDLSFNGFSKEEGILINDTLTQNNTLYGFHFEGNSGIIVDNRGFLQIPDSHDLQAQQNLRNNFLKRRIDSVKAQGQNIIKDKIPTDTCWICDGWVQYKFVFNLKTSGKISKFPVFLHLDFEEFSPILMELNEEKEYICYRMLPPNQKVRYFFTNPVQQRITYNRNPDFQSEKVSITQQKQILNCQYIDGTIIQYKYPDKINFAPPQNKKTNVINSAYLVLVNAKPRDNGGFFQLTVEEEWDFNKSLFKDYKVDNEQILNQCFEFDWKNNKIQKLIKDESHVEDIKEILRSKYKSIKATYKVYAALGMQGDIFCITQNGLTDLLSKSKKIIDSSLKLKDVDINFIMTNQSTENNPKNPQRGLVRCQLMEIIFRLAQDKYFKTKICNTPQEALNKLLDEGLQEILESTEDFQYWRDNRYWNKECDTVFKDKLEQVKSIYNRFCGSKREKMAYTHLKFMTQLEFKEMCTQFNLFDDWLVERDASVCYNIAMMTQIDELYQDRFLQMSFVEFLEAFARMAEKMSPVPIGENPDDYTDEERVFQPLSQKIDTLLSMIQNRQDNNNTNVNIQNTPKTNNTPRNIQQMTNQSRKQSIISNNSMGTFAKLAKKESNNNDQDLNSQNDPNSQNSTPLGSPLQRMQSSKGIQALHRRKSQIFKLAISNKKEDAFAQIYGRESRRLSNATGIASLIQQMKSPKNNQNMETLQEKEQDEDSEVTSSDQFSNSEEQDDVKEDQVDYPVFNLKKKSLRKSISSIEKPQQQKSVFFRSPGKKKSGIDFDNPKRRSSIQQAQIVSLTQKQSQGIFSRYIKPIQNNFQEKNLLDQD